MSLACLVITLPAHMWPLTQLRSSPELPDDRTDVPHLRSPNDAALISILSLSPAWKNQALFPSLIRQDFIPVAILPVVFQADLFPVCHPSIGGYHRESPHQVRRNLSPPAGPTGFFPR